MADQPIKVQLHRKKELEAVMGADHLNYCYQCGACVGDCPTARFMPEFNPREIMLRALIGDLDGLTGPDSLIWQCSNCYTCYDRCPQDVRPVEVILALKNLSTTAGTAPEAISDVSARVLETGRSVPVPKSVARQREKLGLPDLPEVATDELAILCGVDKPEGGGS